MFRINAPLYIYSTPAQYFVVIPLFTHGYVNRGNRFGQQNFYTYIFYIYQLGHRGDFKGICDMFFYYDWFELF